MEKNTTNVWSGWNFQPSLAVQNVFNATFRSGTYGPNVVTYTLIAAATRDSDYAFLFKEKMENDNLNFLIKNIVLGYKLQNSQRPPITVILDPGPENPNDPGWTNWQMPVAPADELILNTVTENSDNLTYTGKADTKKPVTGGGFHYCFLSEVTGSGTPYAVMVRANQPTQGAPNLISITNVAPSNTVPE